MNTAISILIRRIPSKRGLRANTQKDFGLSFQMNRLIKKGSNGKSVSRNSNSENVKLYIKNMVSLRCKMVVMEELKRLDLHAVTVELGIAELAGDVTQDQREQLRSNLLGYGLELLDDKKIILIERIKNLIIEMVHCSEEYPKVNLSNYISEKIKYDYTYLSNLFSEVKGITIQQFIISHRIEKVKELLQYNELNLTEISYKLHYSSVAHLSNQFKKVTGLSPSFYKQLNMGRNSNLENVGVM